MWIPLLLACQADPPSEVVTDDTSTAPQAVRLDAVARASRVSVALRGERPSPAELEQVADDPAELDDLVDAWLQTDAFGETVRDLHAYHLWMRADTRPQWPNRYELERFTQQEVTHSFQEAPLLFVEHVVRSGAPYTDILTADYTLADEVLSVMEGLPFDPDGPTWQVSHHVDGRPQSGLLSSTGLWQRWYTNNSGKHRNRANMLSRAFLCAEIGAFDMPVFPTVEPTDNAATADALRNDPACVACHQNLDPLAAYFWPYEINIIGITIDRAVEKGCGDPEGNPDHCYPIRYWNASRANLYQAYDLPPPGYYGEPGTDLTDLGRSLVDDPRFASCTVDTAWAYLTQQPVEDFPEDLRTSLIDEFSDGFDYQRLVRSMVLSDAMADATLEPLQMRPEAYSRLLTSLSGATWVESIDYGDVPVPTTSKYGLRDLSGGVDHDAVLTPNFSPSPTMLLSRDAVAQHAAAAAVANRTLVDPRVTDPTVARLQLAEAATRTTGQQVDPHHPLVDELWWLHEQALALTGDPEEAWRITLRALFLDPSTLTY